MTDSSTEEQGIWSFKSLKSAEKDCALIVSDVPTAAAGETAGLRYGGMAP